LSGSSGNQNNNNIGKKNKRAPIEQFQGGFAQQNQVSRMGNGYNNDNLPAQESNGYAASHSPTP